MSDDDKIQRILRAGGSFILHSNDMKKLKESIEAGVKPGTNPTIYRGVKVFEDKTGCIEEDKPMLAVIGSGCENLSFRATFDYTEWPLSE